MMAFATIPLLCPFTIVTNIFTLKKNTAKMHWNNVEFNIPDNAPLAIYHAALVVHCLVMGLKTNSSPLDVWLSKMEAAIENIASLAIAGNLAVNQLMQREAAGLSQPRLRLWRNLSGPWWWPRTCTRWSTELWRPWLTQWNRRSTSSTCASWASKPRKVRSKRSWCNNST